MIINIVDVDSALSGRHAVTPRTVLFEAFEYASDPYAFASPREETAEQRADFQAVREQLFRKGPLVLTDTQVEVARAVLVAVVMDAAPTETEGDDFWLAASHGEELAEHLVEEESRHVCRTRA
ncbi:hypothetical protein ACFC26_21770 [Kitasatospora purpeofusca]|uniref:hypothetical protein n=1 Tax=Kitasatospora purpeofusca TaxID=67352 RepID=UPI0035D9A6C6